MIGWGLTANEQSTPVSLKPKESISPEKPEKLNQSFDTKRSNPYKPAVIQIGSQINPFWEMKKKFEREYKFTPFVKART